MSEFTFACPACRQHIKSNTSESGSIVECPTCFQKLIAPQAPSDPNSKFVITAQKYSKFKTTSASAPEGVKEPGIRTPPIASRVALASQPATPASTKKFPVAIVLVAVLVLGAGAAIFFFKDTIFHRTKLESAPVAQQPSPKPQPAQSVAPQASDANWTMNLKAVEIPSSTAAGRIHGENFITDRSYFGDGTLVLRLGTSGTVELGLFIDFEGATDSSLSDQTIDVSANAPKAARVTLRWPDGGKVQRMSFDNGYAMRLEFGTASKNKLSGKIYICMPDDKKSYIMGSFHADIKKPKPPKK